MGRYLLDDTFVCFDKIQTCDRNVYTDSQTHAGP